MSEAEPAGQIAVAESAYTDDTPLQLLYGGSIVVQLGSQLYPSVTAAVAELISNAWDADARHAWVSVPFDEDWTEDAVLEVLDDGLGMSRHEAQFKYLVVGRERRRDDGTDRTPGGRLLHGRKGIGKLAAFGTGRRLEVVTQREGEAPIGFALDYDLLRGLEPAQSATVEEFEPEPLVSPDGQALEHGTRVRLSRLQVKRRPSRDRFMLSMQRRFAVDETEMKVLINGTALTRLNLEFALRFPPDAAPAEASIDGDFAVETIRDADGRARQVRWWFGFLDQPIRDELLQGVNVLVRGKQAQRPFKFERTGGTQDQLGYEYLVGEVHADWMDEGTSEDGDLIASNRDALQLEDPQLQPFLDWGQRRLRWALAQRGRLAGERRVQRWSEELPDVAPILQQVSGRQRQALGRVAERLARLEGLEDGDVAELMRRVIDVREQRAAEQVAQEIQALGDASMDRTWQLVDDAKDLESRSASSLIAVRLSVIEQLTDLLDDGVSPPDLQRMLLAYPWIVDLRLDRAPARRLSAAPSAGQAVAIIGPPVSAEQTAPTVVAAFWDETDRPAEDETWLAAVRDAAVPAGADTLLVALGPIALDGQVEARTWRDTLDRSRRQHESWRELLDASVR